MPNWVYNTVTIQGPKSEIDYIKDRLNRPFTLAQETFGMGDISLSGFPTKIEQVTYSNPVFAFLISTHIRMRELLMRNMPANLTVVVLI